MSEALRGGRALPKLPSVSWPSFGQLAEPLLALLDTTAMAAPRASAWHAGRAANYQKSEEQLQMLNQWWKRKTKGGNLDGTRLNADEREQLAARVGLPVKVLENWLSNSRKKAKEMMQNPERLRKTSPKASQSKCEDCGLKAKNYGTAEERRARWCGKCAVVHGGIIMSKLRSLGQSDPLSHCLASQPQPKPKPQAALFPRQLVAGVVKIADLPSLVAYRSAQAASGEDEAATAAVADLLVSAISETEEVASTMEWMVKQVLRAVKGGSKNGQTSVTSSELEERLKTLPSAVAAAYAAAAAAGYEMTAEAQATVASLIRANAQAKLAEVIASGGSKVLTGKRARASTDRPREAKRKRKPKLPKRGDAMRARTAWRNKSYTNYIVCGLPAAADISKARRYEVLKAVYSFGPPPKEPRRTHKESTLAAHPTVTAEQFGLGMQLPALPKPPPAPIVAPAPVCPYPALPELVGKKYAVVRKAVRHCDNRIFHPCFMVLHLTQHAIGCEERPQA
eukprot:SAG31_NODE_1444_length_8321_cov_2.478716_7_plen_509_part_00